MALFKANETNSNNTYCIINEFQLGKVSRLLRSKAGELHKQQSHLYPDGGL